MSVVQLRQLQTQAQVLAPQLRQSLKILQASALDLQEMINAEMNTNPTLEEVTPTSEPEGAPIEAFDAYDGGFDHNTDRAEAVKRHEFMMASLTSEVTLQEHLSEQVGCMDLPKKLREKLQRKLPALIPVTESGLKRTPEIRMSRRVLRRCLNGMLP